MVPDFQVPVRPGLVHWIREIKVWPARSILDTACASLAVPLERQWDLPHAMDHPHGIWKELNFIGLEKKERRD